MEGCDSGRVEEDRLWRAELRVCWRVGGSCSEEKSDRFTGFTLPSSVLRLLDGGTDVWRNVGTSFSSSPVLEVSDSASEISVLAHARVRSAGLRSEGLLGSQKVPSFISGSDRVALF